MKKYDYIILGTGPAAYKLVKLLDTQHKSILTVESGLFGGTCPNVGCEPKIYLDGAAQTILSNWQFEKDGIISKGGKLNWALPLITSLILLIFFLVSFGQLANRAFLSFIS